MPCTGIITSIRAQGYCPSRPENSTVVLQIINSTFENGILITNGTNLMAECNYSVLEDSNSQKGYVSSDNISIQVQSGGHLSVIVSPNCSERVCLFQPATMNRTNDLQTPSFIDEDRGIHPGKPLLLFVIIRSGTVYMMLLKRFFCYEFCCTQWMMGQIWMLKQLFHW